MFCRKCGKEIPNDSNFCPYCNAPTKLDSNPPQPPPRQYTPPHKSHAVTQAFLYCVIAFVIYGICYISVDTIKGGGYASVLCILSIIVGIFLFIIAAVKYHGSRKKELLAAVLIATLMGMYGSYTCSDLHHQREQQDIADQQQKEQNKKDNAKETTANMQKYDGYMDDDTYYTDSYESLIKLSKALQTKDNELFRQLVIEGTVHKIDKRTSVTAIYSEALDKNAVSVIFNDGKYYLKDGYTFKDWVTQ